MDYYEEKGEVGKARTELSVARNVILAMKEDFRSSEENPSFYEYYGEEAIKTIEVRLEK